MKAAMVTVGACGICAGLMAAVTTVATPDAMPTTGGEGTIRYTGNSGTVATDFALTPAANKAATIEVPTGTALTFSGKVSATGGALVKSGGGVLSFLYPGTGDFTLGASNASTVGSDLTWTDGNAANGFASLTVADGTLEVGTAAMTNRNNATVAVGVRHAATAQPVFRIAGGRFYGKTLNVDRGYSSASRTFHPLFEVADGAFAQFSDAVINSGNVSSFASAAKIRTTGAGSKLQVTGYFRSETIPGTNTLETLDGSYFEHTAATMDYSQRIGLEIGYSHPDRSGGLRTRRWDWTIDGGTGRACAAYLHRGSSITVKNGGALQLDRSMLWFNNNTNDWLRGALHFDGGTIGGWHSGVSELFTGLPEYTVGAGGMTVNASTSLTALDGHAKYADAAARTAGAEIAVTGGSYAALGAGQLPIRVADNTSLIMGVNGRHGGSSSTGRVHSARAIIVSGENALQNMVFDGSGKTTRFRHQGIEADRKRWRTTGHAGFMPDGSLRIGTREWINSNGAAYLHEKVPVNRSFTISWTTYGNNGGRSKAPYGAAAVLQNASALACGAKTTAADCCYSGIGASVAVAYDSVGTRMRFGKNGTWTADSSVAAGAEGWAADPIRCSIAYDFDAKKLVFSIYQPSQNSGYSVTNEVDIASTVGGDSAWFGFTGGTSQSQYSGYHVIGDVRIDSEQGRGYQKVGGMAEIAAGGTWSQELLADPLNLGFVMNELAYGDGAKISSSASTVAGLPSSYHPDVNLGFDRIAGTGTLVKSGAAGLALSAPGAAQSAAVDVQSGKIILRKENIEPPTLKTADGGWCFTGPEIYWTGDGELQFGPLANGGGTSALADPERVMNANTRHRYRVDGAWKCRFHVCATSAKGMVAQGFSFYLHNDPHGCEMRSEGHCGGRGFANGYGLRFWTDSKFVDLRPGTSTSASAEAPYGVSFDPDIVLNASGSEADIEIEHDPAADTLKLTMTQGVNTFAHTWENVGLKAKIGNENRAYISFGANGHYERPTIFRFSNFAFESVGDAPAEEDALTPYFGTLTATGATVKVVLDSTVSNANYRLAQTFNTDAGRSIDVSAIKAPGVLDLGDVDLGGETDVYLHDGAKVKLSAANGAESIMVDGGTLVLSSSAALGVDCRLSLMNGAKIRLDYEGTMRLSGRVTVNGAKVKTGTYSDGNADWIEGGTGSVTCGKGMIISFR